MSYATQADLEAILPQEPLLALTDDEDTGAIVTHRIDTALETASITIDSYLAERYQLPFASPPEILTVICTQIAGYLLHVRRNEMSEVWEKQHTNAIKYLEKVGQGKISLGVGDPVGTGNTDTLQTSSPPAIFSQEEMDKY